MKKITLFIFLFTISIELSSQIQHGFVKTRGRLSNTGALIPGTGLSDVIIQIKGRTTIVSRNDGTFSFPIPDKKYYIQSVKKAGYVLTDADIISRNYSFSNNPHIIVLDIPTQKAKDKSDAELKIRRTLQRELRKKEDEIEQLKIQLKITEDEYMERLHNLYEQQKKNEASISSMAEIISKIDYDQLSEFDKRVNEYILNGELQKADSLLDSKGDISSDIKNYRLLREMNEKEGLEILRLQQSHETKVNYEKFTFKELASRCYSKYEICKLTQQYDSAAYYINLRANIDSTQIQYLLDAIEYEEEFIEDATTELNYERALRIAKKIYSNQSIEVALCNSSIGNYWANSGFKTAHIAEEYLDSALNIFLNCYGEHHKEVARCYVSFGDMYSSQSKGITDGEDEYLYLLSMANEFYQKAIRIYSDLYSENSIEIARCYIKLYNLYNNNNNIYYDKAVAIMKEINNGVNIELAECYLAKGVLLSRGKYLTTPADGLGFFIYNHSNYDDQTAIRKEIENYKNSIPYFKKAQSIYKKIGGIKYPIVQNIDACIEQIEYEINIFEESLYYDNPFQWCLDKWYFR